MVVVRMEARKLARGGCKLQINHVGSYTTLIEQGLERGLTQQDRFTRGRQPRPYI